MFNFIRKVWNDTTKVNNAYVAKDVKGMISFFVGLVLLIASSVGACFGKSISVEAGIVLLSYSLGAQAFKSHYQAKNTEILSGCTEKKEESEL